MTDAIFQDPPDDPIVALRGWFAGATASGVRDPQDAVLATVDEAGSPSTRVLGLREVTDDGLVFFINADTRKGRDLATNPRAAITFYWPETLQQVNMTGTISPTSELDSDRLWTERGITGPAVSVTSAQGQPLLDEPHLRASVDLIVRTASFPKRPPSHHGLVLTPTTVEFWRGRPDRIHQRLHYGLAVAGWEHWRLQP
jgi:pyridoxine/pyridoxamine 5'-phosphate oxidase